MLSQYSFKVGALVCGLICLTACGSGGSSTAGTGGNNPEGSSLANMSSVSSSLSSQGVASSTSNLSSEAASSVGTSSLSSSSQSSTSTALSTSSGSSQSSSIAYLADVQFIYPTQHAHLGGAISTNVRLSIVDDSQLSTDITQILVGGVELTLQGNEWVSSSLLPLTALNDQVFSVELILADNNRVVVQDLVLNNLGGNSATKAGMQRIHSIKGLALDTKNQKLYASDPFSAVVYAVDLESSQVTSLLTAAVSEDRVASLSWPMAFDENNEELYLIQDTFSYSEVLGDEKYNSTLHKINTRTRESIAYADSDKDSENFRISSTKGIFLDTKQSFLGGASGQKATVFTFDYLRSNSLAAWFIGNDDTGASDRFNSGTHLNSGVGLSAFTYEPITKKLFVIREFEDNNKRGSSGIITIESEIEGTRVSLYSELWLNVSELWQPTAIVISPDSSRLLIADSARIWSIDMATKAVSLVTSSNILPEKKGSGVSLANNITAMALDDTTNILYAAGDGDGVIAIDLNTGNRITVLK